MLSPAFLGSAINSAAGAQEDMKILDIFPSSSTRILSTSQSFALSNPVDLSKAAIILDNKFVSDATSTGNFGTVRLDLTSTTNARARRYDTGAQCRFAFYVVEFPNAISVNAYSTDLNGVASASQPINSVDRANNRILIFSSWSSDGGGETNKQRLEPRVYLSADNTAIVERDTSSDRTTVDFYVVELPPL